MDQNIERCDMEIENAERLLREGHPDVDGLTLAIADWSNERRLILEAKQLSGKRPVC